MYRVALEESNNLLKYPNLTYLKESVEKIVVELGENPNNEKIFDHCIMTLRTIDYILTKKKYYIFPKKMLDELDQYLIPYGRQPEKSKYLPIFVGAIGELKIDARKIPRIVNEVARIINSYEPITEIDIEEDEWLKIKDMQKKLEELIKAKLDPKKLTNSRKTFKIPLGGKKPDSKKVRDDY
jgi:hypothetical protein